MDNPASIIFESKGAKIRGLLYGACGTEPLPTVVMCHGFPGGNKDVLGLGEKLAKKGISSLVFNYRGTWGSEGLFTISNSVEDVVSATSYLKSGSITRKLNVDRSSITVLGWSYGGSVALLGSLNDIAIKSVVYIAGGNLSEVGRMMQQSNEFKQAILKMIDQSISESNFSSPLAEKLFDEVFADMNRYDLVKHAEALSSKQILLIGGWRDQENKIEHHMLPLIRALQKYKAPQVKIEMFDTDHSFTNVKTQLADKIVSWIKGTPSKEPVES
jgi:pimeloyl-ACP methyl ester carboxylesterase